MHLDKFELTVFLTTAALGGFVLGQASAVSKPPEKVSVDTRIVETRLVVRERGQAGLDGKPRDKWRWDVGRWRQGEDKATGRPRWYFDASENNDKDPTVDDLTIEDETGEVH